MVALIAAFAALALQSAPSVDESLARIRERAVASPAVTPAELLTLLAAAPSRVTDILLETPAPVHAPVVKASLGVPAAEPAPAPSPLRDALEGLAGEAVKWVEDAKRPEEARRSARRVGLGALRRFGKPADLPQALALLGERGADDVRSGEELEAGARAAEAILRRDAKGFSEIAPHFAKAPSRMREALARGVGATLAPQALPVLARWLGVDRSLDAGLLSWIALVAASTTSHPETSVLERVRDRLRSDDPVVRRAAALAVGRLEDSDATGDLVAMLRDAEPGVASDASWALTRLTGLEFRADARRWNAWYAEELKWWNGRGSAVREALRSDDKNAVRAALEEVGTRRLYRDRWAREVIPLLKSRTFETAQLAVAALGSLRSRAATEPLADLLEGTDLRLRAQAWATLQGITGEHRPAERSAWLEAKR